MNLILLSGNSIKNKEWIEDVEKILKDDFTNTYVHYYKHWKTGEELIDLNYELTELSKTIKKFKKYVVLAKSAGTILTLKGVFESKLNPTNCVFVGVPIYWAKEHNFVLNTYIQKYSIPTLFLQQQNDPFGSSKDLKELLNKSDVKNSNVL